MPHLHPEGELTVINILTIVVRKNDIPDDDFDNANEKSTTEGQTASGGEQR